MDSPFDIEDDWKDFCDDYTHNNAGLSKKTVTNNPENKIPKSNDLYISTKTIISLLNTEISLKEVFWQLPIIPYYQQVEGIVKKQIKFNSISQEELDEINTKKKKYDYINEFIINHIDNSTGRIKFKDVRKLSIGISKKDITSYRCKRKSAFYNCFVIILRLLHNDIFKEVHVKVFNTGKLEIPGIQNDEILHKVYTILIGLLTPIVTNPISLSFVMSKSQIVLINSNFNCGYYLKRDVLNNIFKTKYNDFIRSNYDPCTYPGIQCEIYYDFETDISKPINALTIQTMKVTKNITKVSFMIFRTGSVLIVGKCSEKILYNIYEYLCGIFVTEFNYINDSNVLNVIDNNLKVKRSSRMKTINCNV